MFLRKKTAWQIMTRYIAHRKDDLWKGAVAGAIGGLAGSGAMKLGQWALSPGKHNGLENSPQELREKTDEDPTAQVATVLTEKVARIEPGPRAIKVGGALVHYAFGSGLGAVYGAVSELVPAARYAAGAPFGAAVWAAADLAAVPALGLSKPPNRIPVKQHVQMLGMHIAYGLATDTVRRYMRRAL